MESFYKNLICVGAGVGLGISIVMGYSYLNRPDILYIQKHEDKKHETTRISLSLPKLTREFKLKNGNRHKQTGVGTQYTFKHLDSMVQRAIEEFKEEKVLQHAGIAPEEKISELVIQIRK